MVPLCYCPTFPSCWYHRTNSHFQKMILPLFNVMIMTLLVSLLFFFFLSLEVLCQTIFPKLLFNVRFLKFCLNVTCLVSGTCWSLSWEYILSLIPLIRPHVPLARIMLIHSSICRWQLLDFDISRLG